MSNVYANERHELMGSGGGRREGDTHGAAFSVFDGHGSAPGYLGDIEYGGQAHGGAGEIEAADGFRFFGVFDFFLRLLFARGARFCHAAVDGKSLFGVGARGVQSLYFHQIKEARAIGVFSHVAG
ncbi:MAG: hypothetical protein AB1742_04475 [bacterium]